ncbi:hypothetical protein OC861_005687 [Tilletia horrida]|nr:hypothetical protein OC861_005687 [Tilletia horrida]
MSTTVKPTGLEPQLDLLTYNLIKPLLGKGIFKNLRPPSGALLSGPPGTGKTLLALHALSMNKIKCLHLRASDIHSKYTGVSEKTIAEAFDEARKSSPAVVLIDEIDCVFPARHSEAGAKHPSILSQLLVELDNVRDQRVALIATTNCPDNIDPALLRRLPLTVKVPLPDTKARRDVIEAQLINRVKNRHKLTESHFMTLARLTEGDLDSMVDRAVFGLAQRIATAKLPKGTRRPTTLPPLSIRHFVADRPLPQKKIPRHMRVGGCDHT